MSGRQPETREAWEQETAFIEGQAALPTHQRMAAFKIYCDMQARFAAKDGFPDLAERILRAALP